MRLLSESHRFAGISESGSLLMLYFCFRICSFDSVVEASQPIDAGDEDVFQSTVL